jgi:hypothetical protein
MHRKQLSVLPIIGALALGVSACGGDEEADTAAAMPAATETAAKPKVTFASPTSEMPVGSTFTAKVDLSQFKIDEKAVGMKPADGEGHIHFSLDGGKYDVPKYSGANGKLAVQLGTDGKYSPAVAPEITYENIPAGEHTLEVDLANNDHSETGSTAKVTFMVEDKQAKAGPNGEKVSFEDVETTSDGFTATVALNDFEIDEQAVGKKPETGMGHLHFELDGGKYDSAKYSGANGKLAEQLGTDGKYSPAVAPEITYENLPAGRHVLKVYVANNDHSENGAVAQRTIRIG